MKRFVLILALVLLAAASTVALAGDGSHCDRNSKAHVTADHHKAAKEKIAQRAKHGWLGVQTEKAEAGSGYVITKVYPDSPAAAAGFRSGDVLVALNGIRFSADNKAELKAAKQALWPGSEVEYTIERGGSERQVAATLAPVPREVLAQWEAETAHEMAHEQIASAND